MSKNKNRREMKPFPKFEAAQTFTPDEFNTALNWYQNAALKKAIVSDPTEYKLNLELAQGEVEQIGFTDIPINRGMMALKERYGNDSEKFFSVASRLMALFHIMKDKKISKYIQEGEEFANVHPAVTDAAALVMLDSDGLFPVDKFLAKIEELATTKYKDED